MLRGSLWRVLNMIKYKPISHQKTRKWQAACISLCRSHSRTTEHIDIPTVSLDSNYGAHYMVLDLKNWPFNEMAVRARNRLFSLIKYFSMAVHFNRFTRCTAVSTGFINCLQNVKNSFSIVGQPCFAWFTQLNSFQCLQDINYVRFRQLVQTQHIHI